MSTLHTEIGNTPKQRGLRFWIGCFTLLLISPFLFYYGYCWGLWGRNSLLLQYLFQCKCPATSEEARYAEEIEVIVSACRHFNSRLSPSGRFLYVQETESRFTSTYLLDLQTNEKIPFTLPDSAFYFLTDDLLYIFVYYVADEYILDRTTGMMYPIHKPTHLEPSIYSDGDVVPDLLLNALSRVEEIFLIDESFQPVIALSADFRTHPENSFIFTALDFPGQNPDRVEQFLRANRINYHYVPPIFPGEAVSPNGRFIARHDGIYLVEKGEKIVEGVPSSVRGWTYDGRGVVYSSIDRCLVHTFLPFADDTGCIIDVDQPVLLLKVPEEYLSSTQTP